MLRLERFALIFILLSLEELVWGEIRFKKGAPQVTLPNNAILSGRIDYSREGRPFHSFIGVPYGKFAERFAESHPAPSWDGILNATDPGPACVQVSMDPSNPGKNGEEDCLNLHVYVPMNNTQLEGGFPVMVWVHGGGFSLGSGYEYGPKYFMDEDVILITMNYRLGVFGFLNTGDSILPGNNGLKDLVLGLRWVQNNIKTFGGNPEMVTIFGESAGAALVHYLMLSATTDGLFHRAISQSGTALAPWAYNPDPRATAVKLATHLGCKTSSGHSSEINSHEILTCLRGITADELTEAAMKFLETWPPGGPGAITEFGPVKESKDSNSPFITESPWKLILEKSAPHKEIPWIVGVTEDECVVSVAMFLDEEGKLLEELDSKWIDIILELEQLEKLSRPEETAIVADKIRKYYFEDKSVSMETIYNLADTMSDAWFVYGAKKAALETSLKGPNNPVYLYQYAHRGPVSMLKLFGLNITDEEMLSKVIHTDDLLLQCNLENMFPGVDDIVKFNAEQDEFSKNFIKLWVSFATHGKPSHTWATSNEEWKPIPKSELEESSPLRWYRLTSSPGYMDEGQWKKPKTFSFWDQLYTDHFLHALLPREPTQGTRTEL